MCFSNQRVIDDGYKAFLRSVEEAMEPPKPGAITYGAFDSRGNVVMDKLRALKERERWARELRDEAERNAILIPGMDF